MVLGIKYRNFRWHEEWENDSQHIRAEDNISNDKKVHDSIGKKQPDKTVDDAFPASDPTSTY